jgi:hypothetical protein
MRVLLTGVYATELAQVLKEDIRHHGLFIVVDTDAERALRKCLSVTINRVVTDADCFDLPEFSGEKRSRFGGLQGRLVLTSRHNIPNVANMILSSR